VPAGPRAIIAKLLHHDPNLRPTARELLVDEWLSEKMEKSELTKIKDGLMNPSSDVTD